MNAQQRAGASRKIYMLWFSQTVIHAWTEWLVLNIYLYIYAIMYILTYIYIYLCGKKSKKKLFGRKTVFRHNWRVSYWF